MLTDSQKNLVRIYYPVMRTRDLAEQIGCSVSDITSFSQAQELSRLDDDLMSYREIAECLDMSESGVKGACDRALKKILTIVVSDPVLCEEFSDYLK